MRTRSITKGVVILIAGAISLLMMNPRVPYAQDFIGYSATGIDAAALQAGVDAFRNAVGNPNNGNAQGPVSGGRREINWDGGGATAPATTFPVPMTTFNTAPTTRGAVFTTPGTSFEISGLPSPLFGDLNPTYPGIFRTFSSPRLFTPLGSNITDVLFLRPGTDIPATTNGFGAVFTDVDLPATTTVEYFNRADEFIGKVFVPPAASGLSFVGVVFNDQRIARVRITTGQGYA